ncbi:hypothetical protein BC332_21122 [Capsicum chinense]|nr:hypothetical protein BC332_21122 [Capsicum chinense]
MNKEERVVACGTCKNPIHEECLMAWKRSNRRRSIRCVICRPRWRDVRASEQQEKYLNLSAYDISSNNGMHVDDRQSHCGN